MEQGTVIILNGASSSGKTSILRAFQDMMPEPYLDMGIDRFIWMMPQRYLERPLWDDVLGSAIQAGQSGQRLVSAMQHAIASVAGLGTHVIADHVLIDKTWVDELAALLADKPVYLIGVHCPLEVLEKRERERKNRTLGQARAQFDVVHKFCRYDLTVDSAAYSPEECATQIAAGLRQPPQALRAMSGS
jgi:chloramphenicol 3-O phosphotransferase